jgi:hypothetical protein
MSRVSWHENSLPAPVFAAGRLLSSFVQPEIPDLHLNDEILLRHSVSLYNGIILFLHRKAQQCILPVLFHGIAGIQFAAEAIAANHSFHRYFKGRKFNCSQKTIGRSPCKVEEY